jgi:hypothetical protein
VVKGSIPLSRTKKSLTKTNIYVRYGKAAIVHVLQQGVHMFGRKKPAPSAGIFGGEPVPTGKEEPPPGPRPVPKPQPAPTPAAKKDEKAS